MSKLPSHLISSCVKLNRTLSSLSAQVKQKGELSKLVLLNKHLISQVDRPLSHHIWFENSMMVMVKTLILKTE